jgi:hypothetical protein
MCSLHVDCGEPDPKTKKEIPGKINAPQNKTICLLGNPTIFCFVVVSIYSFHSLAFSLLVCFIFYKVMRDKMKFIEIAFLLLSHFCFMFIYHLFRVCIYVCVCLFILH